MIPDRHQACGHCVRCRAGQPLDCIFPVYVGSQPRRVFSSSRASDFESVVPSSKASPSPSPAPRHNYYGDYDCYKRHKPLIISVPGGGSVVVYGGRASTPVIRDADVYCSLTGFSQPNIKAAYPWEDGPKPIIFTYEIADMRAPSDPVSFKKMISWFREQALAGKKIHVGCVGGHGRTGMVLAALVRELSGIVDAITYVRDNYCTKAVESEEQVRFLVEHFGVKECPAAKAPVSYASRYKGDPDLGGAKGGGYGSLYSGGSVLPSGWPNVIKNKRHNERFKHASPDAVLEVFPRPVSWGVWHDDID
jgi:hypothetical protein